MNTKTILLIDDEQNFLEPLTDALQYEGYKVLKARTGQEALQILEKEKVDLVTIDIMLDPGKNLKEQTNSHATGLFLCKEIRRKYPTVSAFCLSVISEIETIQKIESLGIKFIRKGETSLRKVLELLRSELTGIAFSTDYLKKKE
jgi:DNA-binding response OmpR family regulator